MQWSTLQCLERGVSGFIGFASVGTSTSGFGPDLAGRGDSFQQFISQQDTTSSAATPFENASCPEAEGTPAEVAALSGFRAPGSSRF